MDELLTKINLYAKDHSQFLAPALQNELHIGYHELSVALQSLQKKGSLKFLGGMLYEYNSEPIKDTHTAESQSEDEDKATAERRAYLEARRQELIRRMQAEMDDAEDDDEEDEENDEESDEDEMDEDELHYKAAKLIIEKGTASASLFQRSFPIGYVKACRLIDWMESKGYVSASDGSKPRKVLITQEMFDKNFNEPHLVEDEDEDDEIEWWETLNMSGEVSDKDECEEEETYDRIIKRIFESGSSESELSSNDAERKEALQRIVTVLNKVVEKKKEPISAEHMPAHPSWSDEDEFAKAVMERLEVLVKSDKRMGKCGAVKKAETWLEAVRDTYDRKMMQVYERLVYEIKNTSSYLYGQLKKQFFG